MILHDKTEQEFGYTFDTASQYKNFYCICDYCGKEFLRCKRTITQCNQVISKDSCGVGLCKKIKSEEVQLIKYGEKNIGGSKESIEKRKKTCLEKYNNENYQKSEARKEDNVEKYGVEHHTQTKVWKDNLKIIKLEKYGVDHHTKSKEYQEKLKKKFQEKYGVDHFMKTAEFKENLKNIMFERYGEYYISTPECREKIISTCLEKYGKCFPVNKKFGKTQEEILSWINSLGFNFVSNVKIVGNKEIDLYDSETNIGIEYCGLYWHNELSLQPKLKNYHYSKYVNCNKNNIRLITIFEDEWKNRQNQCKDFIRSLLNKNKRIYARKCIIKEISKKDANVFYYENHIIGKCSLIDISYGLFYENDLVGAISLGKHPRNVNELALNRLCFKQGIQVIGGSSKLFQHSIKWCKDKEFSRIISWSDNRWSSGNVYQVMGFRLDEELGPDYSYVDLNNKCVRLTKQSQKKSKTKCPEGMTEREWCLKRGLARIWDCGKKRWVYYL